MKSLMIFATILFGLSPFLSAQIKFENLSLHEALEQAKNENKLVFVDVFAPWCGPCKMLSANVFPNKELGDFMNQSFVNIKIDGDQDDNRMVMEEFDLRAFPTLLMINPETNSIRKIEGYVEADEIIQEGQYAIDPRTTPVAQLKNSLNEDPSRENHRELLNAMIEDRSMNDEELNQEASAFLKKYPKLDLDEEMELYVFCVEVTKLDDINMQNFLENLDEYSDEIIQFKFLQLVQAYLEKSQQENDISITMNLIDQLYPKFEAHLDEGFEIEEIRTYVTEKFEE